MWKVVWEVHMAARLHVHRKVLVVLVSAVGLLLVPQAASTLSPGVTTGLAAVDAVVPVADWLVFSSYLEYSGAPQVARVTALSIWQIANLLPLADTLLPNGLGFDARRVQRIGQGVVIGLALGYIVLGGYGIVDYDGSYGRAVLGTVVAPVVLDFCLSGVISVLERRQE
jgi:hypothetical protein